MQLPLPNINLATYVLTSEGKDINDYDGWCSSVSEQVNNVFGGSIVYVDGDALDQYDWSYHMVPMVNGLIHDAWLDAWHLIKEPQTLSDWMVKMFGTEDKISVTIDGNDVYTGLPQNFSPVEQGLTIPSNLL